MDIAISINYWAVFVAALIPMALGFGWYSALFGKRWMALMEMTEEEIREKSKGKEAVMYGGSFVASLVTAYVLAHIVEVFTAGEGGLMPGIEAGFWCWLGFVAAISLQSVTFEFRKIGLWVLNVGYNLLVLMVMGAVLGMWQ